MLKIILQEQYNNNNLLKTTPLSKSYLETKIRYYIYIAIILTIFVILVYCIKKSTGYDHYLCFLGGSG